MTPTLTQVEDIQLQLTILIYRPRAQDSEISPAKDRLSLSHATYEDTVTLGDMLASAGDDTCTCRCEQQWNVAYVRVLLTCRRRT